MRRPGGESPSTSDGAESQQTRPGVIRLSRNIPDLRPLLVSILHLYTLLRVFRTCNATFFELAPRPLARVPALWRHSNMASNLPIPIPPRTPTPPPDDPPSTSSQSPRLQDKDSLSPLRDTFPNLRGSLDPSDANRLSPTRAGFNLSPADALQPSDQSDNASAGPFNFKTTTMAKSPVVKSVSCRLLPPWKWIY